MRSSFFVINYSRLKTTNESTRLVHYYTCNFNFKSSFAFYNIIEFFDLTRCLCFDAFLWSRLWYFFSFCNNIESGCCKTQCHGHEQTELFIFCFPPFIRKLLFYICENYISFAWEKQTTNQKIFSVFFYVQEILKCL